MNDTDDLFRRLLETARRVPPSDVGTPTPAFETRVLSAWRGTCGSDEPDALQRFLRIGLGFATGLTLMIIAFSLREIAKQPSHEFAMPNLSLHLALSQ